MTRAAIGFVLGAVIGVGATLLYYESSRKVCYSSADVARREAWARRGLAQEVCSRQLTASYYEPGGVGASIQAAPALGLNSDEVWRLKLADCTRELSAQ